jgi:hypothetical protein
VIHCDRPEVLRTAGEQLLVAAAQGVVRAREHDHQVVAVPGPRLPEEHRRDPGAEAVVAGHGAESAEERRGEVVARDGGERELAVDAADADVEHAEVRQELGADPRAHAVRADQDVGGLDVAVDEVQFDLAVGLDVAPELVTEPHHLVEPDRQGAPERITVDGTHRTRVGHGEDLLEERVERTVEPGDEIARVRGGLDDALVHRRRQHLGQCALADLADVDPVALTAVAQERVPLVDPHVDTGRPQPLGQRQPADPAADDRDAQFSSHLARLVIREGLDGPPGSDRSVTAQQERFAQVLLDLRRRQEAGELGPDLDAAAVGLAMFAMGAAAVSFPHLARAMGLDPDGPDFAEHYAEQIARMVSRLAGPPRDPGPDVTSRVYR